VWTLAGLAAGVGLWFVSGAILVLFGFSFYAVIAAVFLELVIWIIVAVLVHKRVRTQRPETFKYRVAPLLAGMLIVIVYIAVGMIVSHPHAILPG